MTDRWTQFIIIALLLLVVGVPFALQPRPDEIAGSQTGPRPTLVIVSPHNEQIRFEFTQAYNRWRTGQGKSPVVIDWRSWGGTSDLRKGVLAEFTRKALAGRENEGIGYDLFFGGGDFEHNQLARGVTVSRDNKDVTISITVPIELPTGLLQQVYPTPDIGGSPLYHRNMQWLGVCLSSFGIVYNRDVHQLLSKPAPTTWADLAQPSYQGWVALADPSHSGSIAVTYETILRRAGWTEGWAMLRRSFANARYFTSSAGKVPVDVSAGEAAAGMCIDFFGRFQAGAIGGDRVGYVDPPYMTAITADPVSILLGSPAQQQALAQGQHAMNGLANEFVLWLLTPEAQGLWQRRVGTPNGPTQFELRRLPIRRDMFVDQEMQHWADPVKPFEIARALPAGMPGFYRLVAPVSHAIGIDVHDDLRRAWRHINQTSPDDPRRARMFELFDAMPAELTLTFADAELTAQWRTILEDKNHARHKEVSDTLQAFVRSLDERYKGFRDQDKLLEDRLNWTRFFRNNYRLIVNM